MLSDSEDESTIKRTKPSSSTRPEPKSAARVKRGVVISDDEDEESKSPAPPARPKAAYKTKAKVKAATPDPDAEKELRAMMDIDDGK
jgi:hypothetical protein